MFCINCGKKIIKEAKFCPYCGAEQGFLKTDISLHSNNGRSSAGIEKTLNREKPKHSGGKTVAAIAVIAVAACFAITIVPGLFDKPIVPVEDNYNDTDIVPYSEIDLLQDSAAPSTQMAAPAAVNEDEDLLAYDGDDLRIYEPEKNRDQYYGQFIIQDSNTRFIDEYDLIGMSEWELYLARNEIFAWYGRGFKSEDLHAYFIQMDWYTELCTSTEFDNSPSPLNEYERENAKFILAFEKEIDSYYLK